MDSVAGGWVDCVFLIALKGISMAQSRKYSLTLFGATGFTGGLCADYLGQHLPEGTSWALAGRNPGKLEAVRARLQAAGATSLPGLIEADVDDQASLNAMAQQSKVVITTVGPYVFYGEGVVRACADHGTHYCDLTGEPEFVCNTLTRYHESAKKTGAAIVSCCGFDSIPHDAGALFTVRTLAQKLGGQITGQVTMEGVVSASATFSGGTWQSAISAFGRPTENRYAMKHARIALNHQYPESARILPMLPKKDAELGGWLAPMPTIDPFMVVRSARAVDGYGPDFRYGHFLAAKSLPKMLGGMAGIGGLVLAAQIKPIRNKLLEYRQSGDGPPKEKRDRSWFKVLFRAKSGGEQVMCEVAGGDPGYDETAKMLAETAMCLALDSSQPKRAGVLTPVMACEDRLIERLQAAGMTFREL